jgi:hypothetical protein
MQYSRPYYKQLLSLSITTLLIIQIFVYGMPGTWLGPVGGEPETWWNTSWTYRKSITIDHTKVNAALSNFPVLIDVTDGDLASKAQADGDDIAFTDEDAAKLNHEIEFYNSTDGRLVVWVSVPSLSSSVDTVLYMYYGNAGASNQENVTAVWDSNFMMVQHLCESSGTHYDSTSNDNDGTAINGTLQGISGKIDGADDFDGTNDEVSVPHSNTLTGFASAFTASAWVKLDDVATQQGIINKYDTEGNQRSWYLDFRGTTSPKAFGMSGSADGVAITTWTASYAASAGTWYHVALVWQSGQVSKFYVNGQQLTTTGAGAIASIYNNTATPLYIGRAWSAAGERFLDGTVDEARISNVARSSSWIATSYNNQNNPSSFYAVGTEEAVPLGPAILDPSPADTATGVSISLTQLGFNLSDPQSDPMNCTVTTSPNIGSDSGTNVGDGRYNVTVSGLAYDTEYTWNVNATDGTNPRYKVFTFTTQKAPGPWWNAAWSYRKEIVIDHTKVNATLSNFPLLIDVTDGDLASEAQADGDDIAFTEYNGSKLNHEIELYNSGIGRLIVWVSVPDLSSSVDTVLYMYYGNAGASSQENVAGVWDSNFMMVQHLSETSGTHYDSTANDNDGTASGATQGVTGKIDGADDFDGTNDEVSIPHSNTLTGFTGAMTVSVWVRLDDVNSRQTMLNKYNTTNNQRGWALDYTINQPSAGQNACGLIVSSNGVTYESFFAPYTASAGQWVQVAAVWTPNQTSIPFYINGVLVSGVGTQGVTVPSIFNNTAEALYFGRSYPTSPERYLDGMLDEAQLSNIARSSGWIITSYNNQRDPSSFYSVEIEEAYPGNRPPSHSNPLLISSLGTNTTDENLICYNQSTSDLDGDTVTNIYNWYRNSTSLANLLTPFDLNSSAIVKDYSGRNNTGNTNATWTSSGKIGGCYSFNGSGTAVSIPDASSLDGDGTWTELTLEQWIYLTESQTGTQIIAKMSTTAEAKRSYQIGIQSSKANQMYAAVMVGSNSYQELIYTGALLNSSQWYHVTLTYKSGDRVRLYIDGVQVNASASIVNGNIQASPDKPLLIGRRFDGRSFKGTIDEVKLYPFALSSQQIYQHYLESKDGLTSNSTVVPQETSVNDIWKCEVTPSDGMEDGIPLFSNTLTIVSPPAPYDDVIFDSSFEMGNLINVQYQDGNIDGYRYYTAELNYSTATFSENHCWFYFSIDNATGKTVRIELRNLASADFTPEGRWQSVEPVYTYDNIAWSRVPYGNYSCGDSTTRNFTITLSPAQKAWIARVPAYTVTMRDNLFASFASSPYFDVSSLGTTPLGQDLKVATITDPNVTDTGKFKIYIIAQQHSGETVPSFVAEGLIRFLLNDTDSVAENIRKSYIFRIVPIVNVEGNHYGICRYTPFRAGAQYDLNRAWDDNPISTTTVPEVNWTFTDIQNWMPDAFMDLHSDSVSLDCFNLHDGLYDTTMINFLNNVSRGFDGTKDYWPETGSRATCNAQGSAPNVRTRIGVHPAVLMEHPNDDRTNTTAHPTDHNPQTIDDWKEWGKRIVLGVFDYFGEAGNPNLIVESIVVDSQGCSIYANDTYANGTAYYVYVRVTVKNDGTHSAGQFNVSLAVYWTTGSQQESLTELAVLGLDAGENTTLVFYWRPTHTRYYNLTAYADCHNEITEDSESDNTLSQESVPVTVIGDINGDGTVNIFDAVIISLAWNSSPGSGHWNKRADINHDDNVDILDGARISLYWGTSW